jgi:lipopolysaccharide transport system permease protein
MSESLINQNNTEDSKLLQERVYTPESKIRHPVALFKEMWQDLLASRELTWQLLVRDISAQYRQSLLGILWVLLTPLATAGIFIMLKKQAILNVEETGMPYPVFALIGTTLWQTFVESINAPLKSLTAARPMLAKIKFPYEALMLAGAGQVLFNFGLKLLIIALVFLFFKIPLTIGLFASTFAILMLILLGLFIGLLLTPLGALYTDISRGLVIATNLWFFITPVIYPPLTTFPFNLLATVNPVSPVLIAARDLMIKGALENMVPFLTVSAITLVGTIFVWILYRLSLPILIERMSA